ncbi:16511_t:CDS:1 [Acaulospora morrowiae]|uniref:16511_t:CDS:1 n=1 Tax=Acaulospora morrowiae TaxID=94023 RepID=A0A9N9ERQ2_9GLOM|nr:16511_t:CDS:1 [Acaulospora morrowiae]
MSKAPALELIKCNTTLNEDGKVVGDEYCKQELGPGYVCATSSPAGYCIYACHDNPEDCAKTQYCDTIVSPEHPRWLCTCEVDEDCLKPSIGTAFCNKTFNHCEGSYQ